MTTLRTDRTTTIVPFTAGDGMLLNLHHVTGPRSPTRGPVLLVHGAGVRADIFRPPEPRTLVDALIDEGWDVWLENWRASIDHPPNEWDLDQAAVFDHPAAVDAVLTHTGAESLKAVVHCQGSTSFALAAVAGLLPAVDTIVSNAVSLHPVVPPAAVPKLTLVAPALAPMLPFIDPRWGLQPLDERLARLLVAFVRLTHRECENVVCRMVSFTYGIGFPTLWSHENLSKRTHDWIAGEFGPVPLRFFRQMAQSVRRGCLVTTRRFAELPVNTGAGPVRTGARFVLLAGDHNRCFLPNSQDRTFEQLRHGGRRDHRLHRLSGYGHLDVFLGQDAHRDVFPLILEELAT